MSKSKEQPWTIAKQNKPNPPGQQTSTNKKKVAKSQSATLVRWLHIYLSMVSFALVLFFAVTGLTLNHADWFEDQSVTAEYTGKLAPAWVSGPDTASVQKLSVVEYLRSEHGLKGAVSDFRIDERECSVSFRGPGYSADAFINRSSGDYQLTETRLGLVAVMNDLHKGRDTGAGWAWVIDLSAIFMALVSTTGLVLLLFLKKRRVSGLVWLLIGLVVSVLLYVGLVA